ncbi:hypothetical protein DAPPUDRAFT_238750 [Daphnia pulex]|uniref:Uncharacterized protein n=1 Tax=Daphnia pulex TaxID=6669 RepID=E9G7A3_DAPPU|nr:hypothetical protein DAPPUDRAFT_238750 [Daphnia pulex]|eukprot:EFX84435.1 hypothetical protein DAPPUDRAFT_238750 [Daphnia pulex]
MSDSEKAKVKDGNLPAMNVGETRIPLSNHHEKKAEAPQVIEVSEEFEKSEELEESEDNERCKTVVISGARVKGKKVFSPKASIFLGAQSELNAGLVVEVGGNKVPLPKHRKGKAEEPKFVEESEESEESEEKERLETDVVISGARIKGKEVFSPKSPTLLGTKAELDLGLKVKVGGKKLPKHPKGKSEAPKVVKESEESEEEERPKPVAISGARVQGKKVFSSKASIFLGREEGVDTIETLCRAFNAEHLKNHMLDIFQDLKGRRNLTTAAAAVFIFVYRKEKDISIKQIAPVLNVTPPVTHYQLGATLKKLERYLKELPEPPQLTNKSTTTCEAGSSRSIPVVLHHARSVLPSLRIHDPFKSSVEITERVYNITNNIVSIFDRRTKQSFDRRIITIAAGFLAWQSCHYHHENFNSGVPFKELIEPNKTGYFQKYLTLTNLDIGDGTARHIERSVTQISKELLPLFQHMTWIEKEGKCTNDIPKYLEQIFQFQDIAIEALYQEEETARINEPITAPVIPRELTAEEEAILDAPDLNENDLPDTESSKYFFSEKELNPLNVNLSLSADLDSELAEPNKKGKKKRSKSKPTSLFFSLSLISPGCLGFFRMLFHDLGLAGCEYAQSASMPELGPEMNDQRHQQRRALPSANYTYSSKHYTEASKYYSEEP